MAVHEDVQKALEKFRIEPCEIEFGSMIGHGSFGSVFKGTCRKLRVAVKVLKKNLDELALQKFWAEVEMLHSIRHPNVVLFMGACTTPSELIIVTELLDTDLQTLLFSNRPLTMMEKLSMALEAAKGLNWLHSMKPMILHRDIKASNFLVDEHLHIKIADFGLAHFKAGSEYMRDLGKPRGTFIYMAPEVMLSGVFNEKADIYSFGLVLWQIITREQLFPEYLQMEKDKLFPVELIKKMIMDMIMGGGRPPMPPNIPRMLEDVLTCSWALSPHLRPSCEVIVDCITQIQLDIAIPAPADEKPPAQPAFFKNAADFWKRSFDLQMSVPWHTFCTQFCAVAGVISQTHFEYEFPAQTVEDFTSLPPVIQAIKCFHALLTNKPVFFQKRLDDVPITAERFGAVILWLGGWQSDLKHILAEALRLCSQASWFFGDLSTEQAVSRLKGKALGSYLVRFSSSSPGSYTVSYIQSNGRIQHTRITQHYTRVPSSRFEVNDHFFSSLGEIIAAFDILAHPVTGSPYNNIFETLEDAYSGELPPPE